MGSRTTACHMDSSASRPSPNVICTSSTTLPQLDASVGAPLLISSVSYPAAYTSFSFILAAAIHPFRCSARIPEGPQER